MGQSQAATEPLRRGSTPASGYIEGPLQIPATGKPLFDGFFFLIDLGDGITIDLELLGQSVR